MNGSKLSFLILSLPAMAVLFPYSVANAALRISNSSLIKNQAQINTERAIEAANAAATAAAAAQIQTPQPARTFTDNNGETVPVSEQDMQACNAIYPNGRFDWISPTTGRYRGGSPMCSALIELRSYKSAAGNSYSVLAYAYLGAGDSMKCNIDSFSELTPQGKDYEYPADEAPTIEEVAAVMAQENKSNAGWKILGAAVVGGLGGNLLGKGDVGSDAGLGLGGDKLKTTAIGAAGAAALMTASTQVNNYKAGSVILSTGVNTVAGAVAGNLMATGDDILKIDKCPTNVAVAGDELCLYGTVDGQKVNQGTTVHYDSTAHIFYNTKTKSAYQCQQPDTNQAEYNKCMTISIMNISFADAPKKANADCVFQNPLCKDSNQHDYNCIDPSKLGTCAAWIQDNNGQTYDYDTMEPDETKRMLKKADTGQKGDYILVEHAVKAGKRDTVVAKVPRNIANKKAFGYKYSDWSGLRQELGGTFDVFDVRDGKKLGNISGSDFRPSMQSANDGDVIDFNNKARAKSTLVGAGGGAALGAISGAAGADAEINERWLAAQREYEGSLGNIACFTGERYLSQYNSVFEMPDMKITEE